MGEKKNGDTNNNGSIRILIILSVILMILFLLNILELKYHDLSTEKYTGTEGLKMLGILFLVSLLVERVVDVFLILWRGEARTNIENDIEKLEDENRINDILSSQELVDRRDDLSEFRMQTQIIAVFGSFFIGLLISLSGYNVLTTFFDLENEESIVINKDFYEKMIKFKSVVKSDSVNLSSLYFKQKRDKKPDSFVVDNTFLKNLYPAIYQMDTSFVALKEDNMIITSKRSQSFIFYLIGILITALMIAGGSEAVHKIYNVYAAFLDNSKKRFDQENKNLDDQNK